MSETTLLPTHTTMIQRSDPPTNPRSGVQALVAKGGRSFPTELLYEIITLTLSQYLTDILIAPVSTTNWDAIGALLHANYHFRCCTLSILDALWDGTFVDRKSGCVSFTILRDILAQRKKQKGIRETTLPKSNICVVFPNSHGPIQTRCFPQRATYFLCARTRHRTSVSDATSLYTWHG